MITDDEGQQYASMSHYHMGLPINIDKPQEGSKTPSTIPDSDSEKPTGEFKVDQAHNVPLVASALMDSEGGMYGMAIDHRVKVSDDDKELLKLHEGTELPYMNDLVKGGMKPSEAYAEAHKWATARETAASVAKWGQEGHEAYKERMREAASIAAEPSDRPRHLDAHTTRYGLDESEGVKP